MGKAQTDDKYRLEVTYQSRSSHIGSCFTSVFEVVVDGLEYIVAGLRDEPERRA